MNVLSRVHFQQAVLCGFVAVIAMSSMYFIVEYCRAMYSFSFTDSISEPSHFESERSMIAIQGSSGFPFPELSLQCFPKTIMPGDTLYIMLIAANPYEKSLYINTPLLPSYEIAINLKNAAGQEQSLLFEHKDSAVLLRPLYLAEIEPNCARIVGVVAINLPPLEDLNEHFWREHLNNLNKNGERFFVCVNVQFLASIDERIFDGVHEMFSATLEVPITLLPRPETEMARIESWYSKTPNVLFPKPDGKDINSAWRKTPQDDFIPESQNIRIWGWRYFIIPGNWKYSQWFFVRLGNRYPSDPNAPTTWQGWKALEASITPSTMRDEIRLTRILIQYCNTKDRKILTELKDWFDSMDEIQRTSLALHIRNMTMARWYYERNLFYPFREVYKAIRIYDITPILARDVEHLQFIDLIETEPPSKM